MAVLRSRNDRSGPPPLDAAALDRLALRYVERFATSRGKLAAYLARKIRERGWDGDPADTMAVADRMAALGYVDDRAFAEARAGTLARRGLGERRVRLDWRAAGIEDEDANVLAPTLTARAGETALAFARRRQLGPYAAVAADRDLRRRQLAAMLRAGHPPDLARRIVFSEPGDIIDLDE